MEMRILVGHDIGKTGALGGFGPMFNTVVESLQNVFRELWWMRVSRLDNAPLRLGEFVITEAYQIHHDPFGGQCRDGMQVYRNPWSRV